MVSGNRGGRDPGDPWSKDLDRLAKGMAPFGLRLSEEKRDLYRRYCAELARWNRRYNLLSRSDVQHVVDKHVAASLAVLLLIQPDPKQVWVDVGTGAGLPGLVLKIWEPNQRICLIDGSRKKCIFLENVVRSLGLGPVPIHIIRAETLVGRGEMIGEFDVLFSRAVADLPTTLEEFGPLVREDGRILTFKGPSWDQDVEAAKRERVIAHGRYRLDEVIRVPWAPGHLLLVRKEKG